MAQSGSAKSVVRGSNPPGDSMKIKVEVDLDTKSWFYKNCKRQRKVEAKICQCCPFRAAIEEAEKKEKA